MARAPATIRFPGPSEQTCRHLLLFLGCGYTPAAQLWLKQRPSRRPPSGKTTADWLDCQQALCTQYSSWHHRWLGQMGRPSEWSTALLPGTGWPQRLPEPTTNRWFEFKKHFHGEYDLLWHLPWLRWSAGLFRTWSARRSGASSSGAQRKHAGVPTLAKSGRLGHSRLRKRERERARTQRSPFSVIPQC